MHTLFEHQVEFLHRNPNKRLICYEMGTGKTRLSIEWAKKRVGYVLIIHPKALRAHWQRELIAWDPVGSAQGRYMLESKEEFRKFHKGIIPVHSIIVDEGHYFAGMTSQMSKSLMWYVSANHIENILILTGTPYLRSAMNVLRLGQILGKDWNYPLFTRLFFNSVRMGHKWIPVQKKDDRTKELLAKYVSQIGDTKRLDECVDVPFSQEITEIIPPTPDHKKMLDDLLIVEPLVRYVKEHQIIGGTLIDGLGNTTHHESNKKERLLQLAGSHDKLIVVCRYNAEIMMLVEALKAQDKGKPVHIINGSIPAELRDSILQSCKKLDEFVLVVNAACSEGWELPEVTTMVFYSHDFSLKNYVQMKGRIQRINNLQSRAYVHLLVEDSIDESVHQSLMNKEDFLIKIYADKKKPQ